MAKTRVAPLKLLTLPWLELMATLIATRLIHFALDTLALQDSPVYIWSDCQIVLHWVQSEKQLPAFVSHRANEMKPQLPAASWLYCPTLENPADLLTRHPHCGSMAHCDSPHQINGQWLYYPPYHRCLLQQL